MPRATSEFKTSRRRDGYGFEVGAGQSGTALQLPPGVPADVAAQIGQLAHLVFTHAFVDAMRPAMTLTLAVVLIAAFVSLRARQPMTAESPAAIGAVA